MKAATVIGRVPRFAGPLLGREDESGWIDQALEEEGMAVLTARPHGVGLTHLAAQWALSRGDGYDWLAWLDAADRPRYVAGLRGLARFLGIEGSQGPTEKLAQRVAEALQGDTRRWVVLIDEGAVADAAPLVGAGGHVVVTAREAGWPEAVVVPISPLDAASARALLRAHSGLTDERALYDLAAHVGGVPSCLRMVAAHARLTGAAPDVVERLLDAERLKIAAGRDAEAGPSQPEPERSPVEAWAQRFMARDAAEAPGGRRAQPGVELRSAVGLLFGASGVIDDAGLALIEAASLVAPVPVSVGMLAIDGGAAALERLAGLGLVHAAGGEAWVGRGVAAVILERRSGADRRALASDAIGRFARRLDAGALGGGELIYGAALAGAARREGVPASTLIPVVQRIAEGFLIADLPEVALLLAEDALEMARGIAAESPISPQLYLLLADCNEALGESAEALYLLQDAVSILEGQRGSGDELVMALNKRRVRLLGLMMERLEREGPGHSHP